METMLKDRDETYENFIHLEYGYTAEEVRARNGISFMETIEMIQGLKPSSLWRLRQKAMKKEGSLCRMGI